MPIDIWDYETFDSDLRSILEARADLVKNYWETDQRQFYEREASDHTMPHPTNLFASDYRDLVEDRLMPAMELRSIRAWHYTRLTDDELEVVKRSGIHISTVDSLTQRLGFQVAAFRLSETEAAEILHRSPFQEKNTSRLGKFWMTSHPIAVDDSGVEPLLAYWGGEAVYFCLPERDSLLQKIGLIGSPVVFEIGVPIAVTRHCYSASRSAAITFARTLGCQPPREAFDLYSKCDLNPQHIIGVHKPSDKTFDRIANGYPARFKS